jgi:hypothetical protein
MIVISLSPVVQAYVYGGVPPLTCGTITPLQALQPGCSARVNETNIGILVFTEKEAVVEQLLASVTVTI